MKQCLILGPHIPWKNGDDDNVRDECDEYKNWHDIPIDWLDKEKRPKESACIDDVAISRNQASKR